MHPFDLNEDSFKPDSNFYQRVSIQPALDGFSFSIREDEKGNASFFRNYPFSISSENSLLKKIQKILAEDEFLSKSFKEAELISGTPGFTLIPSSLFRAEDARAFYEFNLGPLYQAEVVWQHIDSCDIILLHSLPESLKKTIATHFPDFSTTHILVPLMEHLAKLSTENSRFICLYISHSGFFLLIFDKSLPIFINYFRLIHNHDLYFYLMSAVQQTGLQVENMKIIVCGDADKIQPEEFIKKTGTGFDFLKSTGSSGISEQAPFYKYFSLFR